MKKFEKIIAVVFLVILFASITLETYTYFRLSEENVTKRYDEKTDSIFASTCISYYDGCNTDGTPYSRKLGMQSFSTMLGCAHTHSSIPFGFKNVKSKGTPHCVRLQGMSVQETRDYLKANPLPLRK